jgi:rsbT co-antagonist protein RsbR
VAIDSVRVERILAAIVDAAEGNFAARVPLEDVEDELLQIEVGINFLLDDLAAQHQRNLAQQQALIDQAAQIKLQSQALVAALSTPIIVLWPGVLALPLIGDFDLQRATAVTATLLERVAAERARHVILDLTGVEHIATDTLAALLRMVRALELLGVRCLLTGMHPNSARAVVDLGVELGHLHTLARVSDALAQVLSEQRARQ